MRGVGEGLSEDGSLELGDEVHWVVVFLSIGGMGVEVEVEACGISRNDVWYGYLSISGREATLDPCNGLTGSWVGAKGHDGRFLYTDWMDL